MHDDYDHGGGYFDFDFDDADEDEDVKIQMMMVFTWSMVEVGMDTAISFFSSLQLKISIFVMFSIQFHNCLERTWLLCKVG